MLRLALAVVLFLAPTLAGCVDPGGGVGSGARDVGGTAPTMPPTRDVLGTLEAIRAVGNLTGIVVDARIVDCEPADIAWNLTADLAGLALPPVGEEVALSFAFTNGAWRPWLGFASPAEYVSSCGARHVDDVRVRPSVRERASGTAAQILPGVVVLGGETSFTTLVENVAARPVEVRFEHVALVNEDARVAVPGCEAEASPASFTVTETADLRVTVRCAADADPRPTYTACREGGWVPGPAGGEATYDPGHPCRDEEAARPTAVVHAVLSFVDALGNAHTKNVTVSGPLHVAEDATLTLEAPASVAERDEFVIVARYLDAEGRPIEDAQVVLSLEWPGLEDHGFGMNWDEGLQAYRFAWDDFAEWKPWLWREGPHRVHVEALEPRFGTYAPRETETVVEFV